MTLEQSKVVVLAAVQKRKKARQRFMLEAASRFIADLPRLQPMQTPSLVDYYVDFVYGKGSKTGDVSHDI